MFFKRNNFNLLKCLCLILALLLASCGYVSDAPPKGLDVYKVDGLQACSIDIDKLSEIFRENQENQIRCLKENFEQYTKYVKSNSTDSVNQSEIGDFVRHIFKGQSDSVIKGLSILFQLNMILLKDEAQKISKGNITPFFELLITANREAIIITQSIQDMGKAENLKRFFEIREVFRNSLIRFSETTVKIMLSKNGKDQSLNIKDFIVDVTKKLGNKTIDQETINTLIFIKQILVSGDREIITTKELEKLIAKIPNFVTIFFDLYYSKTENFIDNADQAKFYLLDLRNLSDIIDFKQANFDLFSIDQLLKLVTTYYPESNKDFKKFKPSIIALKAKLIGGKTEIFSLYDLKLFLDYAIDLNERIYFDNLTYKIRSELLNNKQSKLSSSDLSPINISEYVIFKKERVTELTKNFNDIAVNFKYFRENSHSVPFYGINYKRNQYGFVEVSIMRWLAQKLVKSYGHFENNEQVVNQTEFQNFLNDMKPILEEFKLWSPNPETFARNAILLADLFQGQSDGNLLVNEKEATEYIGMILSATELSENYRKGLTSYCDPGINIDDPIFEVKCFNENFYQLFLNKLSYNKYFPRMTDYVNRASKTDALNYIKGIEGFARDVNDPKIPMDKRDAILTIGAMVNVETTFIRFDTNFDNILDYNELMAAFNSVYRGAIISLADLKEPDYIYAPTIFIYMVTKMEIPKIGGNIDKGKFYAYHKCVHSESCRTTFMDPIEAHRLNVGKLLYYLVNNPKSTVRN